MILKFVIIKDKIIRSELKLIMKFLYLSLTINKRFDNIFNYPELMDNTIIMNFRLIQISIIQAIKKLSKSIVLTNLISINQINNFILCH